MGDKTTIEWADATWNPTRGCTRVSEGCRHCYAEGIAGRFSAPGQPYEGVATMRAGRGHWTGNIRFVPKALTKPLKWKAPRSVFVNSMSDLFHDGVETFWIDQIMAVMALAPRHTFMVLTKRPDRMRDYFTNRMVDHFGNTDMAARVRNQLLTPEASSPIHAIADSAALIAAAQAISNGPLSNLWLGTSVEDQATADARIPSLLATPAATRFVSAEPLLGPIDFTRIFDFTNEHAINAMAGRRFYGPRDSDGEPEPKLDLIICGGESGAGARPMHPDWARSMRDQCQASSVPFFFKQWGAWANVGVANDNGTHHAWEDGTVMRLSGKKKAGALLDGRIWHQMPPMPHRADERSAEVA